MVKEKREIIAINQAKHITVLDFEVGRVFQYKFVDELEYTDNTYERYITDKGHRLNNCEWMIHKIAGIVKNNDGSYGKL